MLRLAAVILCLVSVGGPAEQPAPADGSFDDFLTRCVGDEHFRLDRTRYPLPVRIGNAAVGDVRNEKWTREQVRKELPPVLSTQELKEKGLDQRVKKISSTRVEVVQFRPEAGGTLRNYTFQKIKGAWYLSKYEDASK